MAMVMVINLLRVCILFIVNVFVIAKSFFFFIFLGGGLWWGVYRRRKDVLIDPFQFKLIMNIL